MEDLMRPYDLMWWWNWLDMWADVGNEYHYACWLKGLN